MNLFDKPSQRKVPIVVLTGGPCGGKTTLMRELRASDPECRRWVLVPEAAPLLFQAGLNALEKRFQLAVVRLQTTLEEACLLASRPGTVLVCHRGTLDALAYWLRAGWQEADFFALTGLNREEHLRRYIGVIHLQTTAIGTATNYRCWPDAHRPETPEQAAETDALCVHAWSGHRSRALIENSGKDWRDKARTARDVLAQWLANDNI